jgi:sodium-dependent phosphate cotransporter
MLLGMSARIIYKATDVNGYLAMLIGAGLTILVQSSSITTSTLTPLVGMGILRLEQMYPLTLGANIGTTITGILAAMVADGTGPLQVALAHLFFNVTGIIIWYPIPFMRRVPLAAARALGKATRIWRGFPLLYIFMAFFVIPILLLGISLIFSQHKIGLTVLGSVIVIVLGVGLLYTIYWCVRKGGKESCLASFQIRERKRVIMKDLPDDMDYIKAKLARLSEHTGLPEEEEDEEDSAEVAAEKETKALLTNDAEQEVEA